MANVSRTLTQLVTAVTQLGFPDPDSGSTISAFINEEYKTIAGERRWEWLQASFTFPLTAGTFTYTLSSVSPGDVRNLDALWITDASGQQYLIDPLDPLKLLDLHQNLPAATVGAPRFWAVWGGQIMFYPNPDQAYTANVAYTKSLGDVPLSGSAAPLLPGDYDTILVWGAAAMMAARAKDWLGRDFMNAQRDRVLAEMRSDYQLKQRQLSDHVEATGIWDTSYSSSYYPGW